MWRMACRRRYRFIVNDIDNFVFDLAGASAYCFCKGWKQKFVMSFIITQVYVCVAISI